MADFFAYYYPDVILSGRRINVRKLMLIRRRVCVRENSDSLVCAPFSDFSLFAGPSTQVPLSTLRLCNRTIILMRFLLAARSCP